MNRNLVGLIWALTAVLLIWALVYVVGVYLGGVGD
jgi:hypothetical protein